MHCQQTAPVLERLSNEMGVTLHVVNVNRYQSAVTAYGITGTPTVIRFADGREQTRVVGSQTEATWRRLLELQQSS